MRKHHFHLQYFSFYDLDGMGRHLEEMAARGWMLEKMTTFGWHYRRMEPKRLRFTVTYQDTFSVFDPEESEGQQEYQDLCRQSGWEVAAANGPLQAFYTEDEDAPPIETDPQLVLETVEKLAKRSLPGVLGAVLIVLQLMMFVNNLQHFPILTLSSPTQLSIPLLWFLLLVGYAARTISYHRWHRKARAAAKAGEFPAVSSHPRRRILLLAVLCAAVCYTLLAANLPYLIPLLLGITVFLSLLFLIPGMVHGILKYRGASAKVNRRWTTIASVASVLLVTAMVSAFIFFLVGNPILYNRKAQVDPPLRIGLLTDLDGSGYTSHAERNETILLRHITGREEAPHDSGLPDLIYEIVDVKFSPVYNLCLEDLTRRYFVPAAPLPGVNAVYQHAKGYPSYVLCWDTRLVHLSADWDLTADQLETAARILAP